MKSSIRDKADGTFHKAKGKVKEVAGKMTDNPNLQAKGKAEKIAGKVLDVELEHGLRDPSTNVTGDDPILTGKIALAHLKELADYYTRLAKMESEAKEKKSQI